MGGVGAVSRSLASHGGSDIMWFTESRGDLQGVVDLASAVGGPESSGPPWGNGQCRCYHDCFVPLKSGTNARVSSAALRAVLKVCLKVGGGCCSSELEH